jgi:ketosteroid isomerase-like protein
MDDGSEFLAEVVPKLEEEVAAIHSGDTKPRIALWSHTEPVTLFGAEMTRWGWEELEPAFVRLAASFGGSESMRYEVIAGGASGDLGYVVGIEHTSATRGEAGVVDYALRVTTVFRREGGEWKVVHRHGDLYDEATRTRGL